MHFQLKETQTQSVRDPDWRNGLGLSRSGREKATAKVAFSSQELRTAKCVSREGILQTLQEQLRQCLWTDRWILRLQV